MACPVAGLLEVLVEWYAQYPFAENTAGRHRSVDAAEVRSPDEHAVNFTAAHRAQQNQHSGSGIGNGYQSAIGTGTGTGTGTGVGLGLGIGTGIGIGMANGHRHQHSCKTPAPAAALPMEIVVGTAIGY